ncbi:MAG: YibE/F family protein [Aeromicrobium sp.]|uniref:YibE/F family protein n=1 Tax=Aeromicrobium sp. TaxID=1871063 RepID=UPI0039E47DCB
MTGMHHHKHAAADTRAMRRAALAVIAPIALLTLIALIWLWPHDGPADPGATAAAEVEGRITDIQREPCEIEPAVDVNGCGTATVDLADHRSVETELPNGSGTPRVAEGDDVVLVTSIGSEDTGYWIVDHQRGHQLWLVAAAFCAAVVAFGRWKGATALVGLAVTFGLVLFFIAPAILAGSSPLLVALVGAAAIMLSVLYLTHGFSLTTTVAVVGTIAAFALTALLSSLAVGALHLTGVTDDLSMAVETSRQLDMQGLLTAGIVIGALGVLDDITVTQAVTVDELARANPHYGLRPLYAAASRVGRSHIASVVNTIVLAYAGASLPMIVITVADNSSVADVITHQFIAQEIVRSVVATLGLIAAVPITTALAAYAATRSRGDAPAG